MKPNLQTTQEIFWQLSQSPEGVEQTLMELKKDPRVPLQKLEDLLVSAKSGQAEERMNIYAQMYFWRLLECLQEDFPATEALLGENAFHELIVAYLQKHPSKFRDISELGVHLPTFIKTWDYPLSPQGRGGAAELAKFEWLQIEVGREADATPTQRSELENIPPEKFSSLHFQLIPACRMLKTEWDVLAPWKKVVLAEKPLGNFIFKKKNTTLLIWRKQYHVLNLEISEEESSLLQSLKNGYSFEALCEILALENEETAPAKAAGYLQQWIERKLLVLK